MAAAALLDRAPARRKLDASAVGRAMILGFWSLAWSLACLGPGAGTVRSWRQHEALITCSAALQRRALDWRKSLSAQARILAAIEPRTATNPAKPFKSNIDLYSIIYLMRIMDMGLAGAGLACCSSPHKIDIPPN
jgi:hypothetical protein